MNRSVVIAGTAAALLLAAVPATGAQAGPRFTPGAAGLGDPYYPLDGNGGYDVQHNDLNVRYDPADGVLHGEAVITARATQNLSAFNFDFLGLTLRSLSVNGRSATWTRDAGELTVTPSSGLERGSLFTVVARYDGVPEQIVDALGVSGFTPTPDGVTVVGQPHVASTWFPANDHPRDRSSFTFKITVPSGLQALANGRLVGQRTRGGWTTWTWDAPEAMASYLATMSIGHFATKVYRTGGISYWDAVAQAQLADLRPAITPTTGSSLLFSQLGDSSYKRLTRTLTVPPGGSTLSFKINRETEQDWDHVFVEARSDGGSDWTTLPDTNGHTSQGVGACPFFLDSNPFLAHYLTPYVNDAGTPQPEDDIQTCLPTGSSGDWNAASGDGGGVWETWSVDLPNTTAAPRQLEVSISYASDGSVQWRGVALDDIVVSSGTGSTSFEADGDVLDLWAAPIVGPDGATNPNTWTVAPKVAAIPGNGTYASADLDMQPQILAFEASIFGPYPFSTSGGIVPDAPTLDFALETQTRPTYSPGFWRSGSSNDSVVVHELAHQWVGDRQVVDTWAQIWLNEGFATYTEWLWSENQNRGTAQESFDFWTTFVPADDPFWAGKVGDPGTDHLFDFNLVYLRGAMTLHALRLEVGDAAFFRIVRSWTRQQAGGTVTTKEFIHLAESISHRDLDALFNTWLFTEGRPATLPAQAPVNVLAASARSVGPVVTSTVSAVPAVAKSELARLTAQR